MSKYIGATVVNLSVDTVDVTGDITATDATPEVIIVNDTHEDTDGGREGKVTFKGQQSGGEETTLAEIQASHDGTSDDEKGDLIFKTNDGSDGSSPTERLRIDSNGSIVPSTLGTSNVKFGLNAGNNIASGGNYNTVIGEEAGNDITTGDNNTLIGTFSGDAITTSSSNTAVGSYSMTSMTDGGNNVAVGTSALDVDTKGSHTTAIGRNALGSQNFTSATDTHNTAVGNNAGQSVTTGTNNTLLGSNVGSTVDTGYDNTFLGVSAGASTTGSYSNTFVGKTSGQLTTGHSNTYLGRYDGNQDSVDIRSYNNMIVLSDGAGSVKQIYWSLDGSMYMRQQLRPWANNSYNLGGASNKWAEFFCNNSTINTSDENEKQQVASLTSAEITAATAISKLFKTYKWNSAVETKGDDARTHTGVIAQQVEAAMTDAGLDASKYAFWCSDTWWTKDREVEAVEANEECGIEAKDAYTFTDKWEKEEDAPEGATKHTVTGVRYAELLAFVSAATEQRLTSIESRLTALEGE